MPRGKLPKPSAGCEDERTCHKCDRVYKTKNILRIHMKRDHENHSYYPCDKCNKSFKTKYYLKTHKTRLHSKTVYAKCEVCNKTFKTKDTYKTHMVQVHTDGTFVCDDCGKHFKAKWYLMKHIQTVHCNIRYTCSICKKNVKYKHLLQTHYNAYHKGVPFTDKSFETTIIGELLKCPHCPQKFEDGKILNSHVLRNHRISSSVQIQSRPSRKKRLQNQTCIDDNIKSEPESDDSIDIADIEFEFNNELNSNGAKDLSNFICDYCKKELKQKESLRRHINTFHTNIYYSCSICGKNIKSVSLQKHYDIFHAGKIIDKGSYRINKVSKVANAVVEMSENIKLTNTNEIVKNTIDHSKTKLVKEVVPIEFDDIDLELKKEFGIDETELQSQYMYPYFIPKEEVKSEIEDDDDIDVGPVILQRPDVDQFDDTDFVVD